MPAYDYVCQDCGKEFEIRMSISAYSEGVRPACSRCGSTNSARSFGAVNVLTGTRGGRAASSAGACGLGGFT